LDCCVLSVNLKDKQLPLRKLVGSVLFSLLYTLSQAQTLRTPLSATNLFLQAYSRKQADVFSFGANQAALANLSSLSVGVYAEQRFLLQELTFYQAALIVPTASGQFGLSGRYMGSSTQYQAEAGLAYARKLGPWVDIGAQFNYYTVKSAGYSGAWAVYAEAGALVHLSEQVHLGMQVRNPTSAAVGHTGEEVLPFVYTAGVGYEVSEQFFMGCEVQKAARAKAGINAGMQYRFDERLWARTGFSSATSSYLLAIGFGLKTLRLDVTASVHPQLGVTPGVQLIFHQNEKTP
jgi:hypothetical protein